MKLFRSMLILLVTQTFSLATVINVPGDVTTIQAGIDGSSDGDTILVSVGTYFEHLHYNGKNVIVISAAGPKNTVIDGSSSEGSVVLFDSGESPTAELNGFRIQNGTGEVNLDNSASRFGGGVCLRYDSSPTLKNLIVSNNNALGDQGSGGGIGISTGSESLIENVIIRDNTAFMGGGLFIYYSSPTIRNLTIENNHAVDAGGGVAMQKSTPIFEQVVINNNTAVSYAGGIWIYDKSEVVLNRVTIYGNSCTTYNGGGIWTLGGNTVYILNSILWNNSPDQIASYVSGVYAAGSIGIAYSDIEGGILGLHLARTDERLFLDNIMDMDPVFKNPANKNFKLKEGSHCIDAGAPLFIWEADTIVNISRDQYMGIAPEMGALESALTLKVDEPSQNPTAMTLDQNFPNPFNPSTRIAYTLTQPALVRMDIYDVHGNHIKTLFSDWQNAGKHVLQWDGSNYRGNQVQSGTYLYRLVCEEQILTRRMLLLR